MPLKPSDFYELVSARRGHFVMESGLHSAQWLDLDALFADTGRIRPFIQALSGSLSRYGVNAVCGPMVGGAFLAQRLAELLDVEFWYTEPAPPADGSGLFRARYRLPAAFENRIAHARVAIVDDVMSAGSSLRATYAALRERGIEVVAVGALMVQGHRGIEFFTAENVPVEAVVRDELQMWAPKECPLCQDPTSSTPSAVPTPPRNRDTARG